MQKLIDTLNKLGISVQKHRLSGAKKIVVPLSGGKDSQSCLKLALDISNRDDILVLFCDTKFEHPITYEHVNNLIEKHNLDFVFLNSGSVADKIKKYKRFPGGGSRHCTDELKIRPTKFFLKEFAKINGGFEVWYGMRLDESKERAERYKHVIDDQLYLPSEIMPSKYPKYLGKLGVRFKLPILDWNDADVFSFLGEDVNPLYSKGFDRVGCFPCLAGGEKLQKLAFDFDSTGNKHFQQVIELAEICGRTVFRTKKLQSYNPPCAVCSI